MKDVVFVSKNYGYYDNYFLTYS